MIARPEKDRICVRYSFLRQAGHMQPSQAHNRADTPIVLGDLVGAVRLGDVDLDNDEIRRVAECQGLDMLIHNHGVIVLIQMRRKCSKPQRPK